MPSQQTSQRTSISKRIFFWLSSAGTETLEQCPNWEQRKYVAFGATVLVPCAFAFIACAYALSTLTENYWVIFSVACIWAFIILTIDRALLASYRAFLSPGKKIGQFTLRLTVAGLMGLTIAHPLVLLLFKDTITGVIEADRSEQITETRSYFKDLKTDALTDVRSQENAIKQQRDRWNETFQAKFLIQDDQKSSAIPGLSAEKQKELDNAITEATKPFTARITEVEEQTTTLTPVYTKIQTELASWQVQFENEVNGERSGIRGLGPRARSIRDDQLAWRRTEAKRLGDQLQHLTEEKSKLLTLVTVAETSAISNYETQLQAEEAKRAVQEERLADLRRKVDEDQAGQFVTQQNQIRDTIKLQIDSMLLELARLQKGASAVANDERTTLTAIADEPRKDILTQTLALHHLFKNGAEGGHFAYVTYMVLTALFMLVDTIPLMVKFFCKAGPYDKLIDRDEVLFDSDHKSFLLNHHQYVNALNSGEMIAVTRDKRLEDAMIDGVEHSRAARIFLDSMIDSERIFQQKLAAEEATLEHGGSKKREMLENMQQSFYDDMHKRMQQFFSALKS
ncbi:MAG: DUF4407 domain-containing protein [Rubritalea sp.]|jgi:hypothetical protein|tara:strand:- start:108 stop:1811 length:1704 start_codon:yes stop_codon:yes gene_type:complete